MQIMTCLNVRTSSCVCTPSCVRTPSCVHAVLILCLLYARTLGIDQPSPRVVVPWGGGRSALLTMCGQIEGPVLIVLPLSTMSAWQASIVTIHLGLLSWGARLPCTLGSLG